MLATEIPGDVHQFDRIQCAASIPGIAGAMGGNPSNMYSTETRPVPAPDPN